MLSSRSGMDWDCWYDGWNMEDSKAEDELTDEDKCEMMEAALRIERIEVARELVRSAD